MLISDAVTLSEELMRKEKKVQEMVELQNKRSSISWMPSIMRTLASTSQASKNTSRAI
jgi:hypothetical protein